MSEYDFLFERAKTGAQTGAQTGAPAWTEDEPDSISSAEEHSKRVGGGVRGSNKPSRATTVTANVPSSKTQGLGSLAQTTTIDPSLQLRIAHLSEIKTIDSGVLRPPPPSSSSITSTKSMRPAKKKVKTTAEAKTMPSHRNSSTRDFYQENPLSIPALHPLFEDIVFKVPYINYNQIGTGHTPTLSHEALTQLLREKKLVKLPVSDAFHENWLLTQAGKRCIGPGRFVDAPPCERGSECEGMQGYIEGLPNDVTGHVLMMYLFPEERNQFMTTGVAPINVKRPCVLCIRNSFFDFLINIHAHRNRITVDESFCIQLYSNPVTGPGAYRQDCVEVPSSTEWQGFVELMVRHERTKLSWWYDEMQQVYRINQTALMAHPPKRCSRKGCKQEASLDTKDGHCVFHVQGIHQRNLSEHMGVEEVPEDQNPERLLAALSEGLDSVKMETDTDNQNKQTFPRGATRNPKGANKSFTTLARHPTSA